MFDCRDVYKLSPPGVSSGTSPGEVARSQPRTKSHPTATAQPTAEDGFTAALRAVEAVYDTLTVRLEGCSAGEAFELVVELLGLQAARLQALSMRALARLAELRPATAAETGDLGSDEELEPYSPFLRDEVAAELAVSPRTAENKLARAWEVVHRLPDALEAMSRGDLDTGRLLALFEVTRNLSAGQRAVVEAQMLAGSLLGSPSLWRRRARRLAARVDLVGAVRPGAVPRPGRFGRWPCRRWRTAWGPCPRP